MRTWWIAGAALLANAATGTARPIPFDNAAGARLAIVGEGTLAGDEPGRLLAAVTVMEQRLGAAAPGAAPSTFAVPPSGSMTMVVRRFSGDAAAIHILLTSRQGGAICDARLPASPAAKAIVAPAMNRCAAELLRQPAVAAAVRPALPDGGQGPVAPPTGGRFAANWKAVEGVYFQAATGFGVGGMITIKFEPIILFRDGTSYEPDDRPLEDTDIAAERRLHPTRFERWSRSGTTFTFTDARGRSDSRKLQDGRFFQAFPATPGTTLAATYKNVSGGGNSAMGGEMSILASSRQTFTPDGRFVAGSDVGAIGSGSQTGVSMSMGSRKRMPVPGRYTLDRHTLVMSYPDGRVERRFFAFASEKSPPRIDREMIFIGDDAYTTD